MTKKRDQVTRHLKKQKTETQTRAWGQCEMFTLGPGGGRCGRSASTETAHLIPRSLGGGHDPEDVAELCNYHHRCIDHRMVTRDEWLWRVSSDGEPMSWSVKKGGEETHVLWGNVGSQKTEQAESLLHEAEVAVEIRKQGSWRLVDALYLLEQGGDLWNLTQYGSKAGVANQLGMPFPTFNRYLKIGHDLANFPPDLREKIKKLPMSFFLAAKLPLLPSGEVGDIIDQALGEVSLKDVIEDAQKLIAESEAESRNRKSSRVLLKADEVWFRVEVEHDPGDDLTEVARKKVGNSNLVIDGGIVWAEGKEVVKIEEL